MSMQSLDRGGRTPEDSLRHRFCTRAATGQRSIFQEIYVCRTCRNASNSEESVSDLPLCICSACADSCHEDHEVEYVGMGPCFCDCVDGSCEIAEESILEATRIGINSPDNSHPPCHSLPVSPIQKNNENEESSSPSYIRDVYHVPLLQNNVAFRHRLVQQAKELIRHSRDTFWLDTKEMAEGVTQPQSDKICDLELLAWHVFRRHVEQYCRVGNQGKDDFVIMGAEWWVQVKPVSSSSLKSHDENSADALDTVLLQEAIDLHYDKDEEMAASFGLGVFPSLSTVTYLTDSMENASPTLIFSRRYDSDAEERMTEMFISHPSCGKHIVFDGRLLHGAPAHPLLRRHQVKREITDSREPSVRITFLVNVWLNYKPARVNPLPPSIRESIWKTTNDSKFSLSTLAEEGLGFRPVESVPTLFLSTPSDLSERLRDPIELPFVGGTSTWADDDDDELSMVVKVYPPPQSQHETAHIQFGPGLEATLDYIGAMDGAAEDE